jgi:hypothetical protein
MAKEEERYEKVANKQDLQGRSSESRTWWKASGFVDG